MKRIALLACLFLVGCNSTPTDYTWIPESVVVLSQTGPWGVQLNKYCVDMISAHSNNTSANQTEIRCGLTLKEAITLQNEIAKNLGDK